MRLARRLASLLLLIYIATSDALAVERWRSYLSYGATVAVAETPDQVYALSREGTLLAMPKRPTGATSPRLYGREDGLSEARLEAIAYAPEVGALLLYYPSGRIDLMHAGRVQPVGDLLRTSSIRDYHLESIRIAGEKAWLAGGFGLVELDLRRGVLLRSAFVGSACQAVALAPEEKLTLLRQGRLYQADAQAPSLRPSAWSPLPLPADFPTTGWRALADDGQARWLLDGAGSLYLLEPSGEGRRLSIDGREAGWERLTATAAGIIVTRGDRSVLCSADGTASPLPGRYAVHFSAYSSQALWGATQEEGLRHYQRTPSGTWKGQDFVPKLDAPATDTHFALRTAGGRLYSVSGGRNFDRYYAPGVVQVFDGQHWQAWTERSLRHPDFPSLYDPVDILPFGDHDPTHVYVATWGDGLFELQGGKILRHYGVENSPLHTIPPAGSGQVRVGPLQRDRQGTLYLAQGMSGSTTGAPVRSLSSSGVWRAYDYPEEQAVNAFQALALLPRGTKWLAEHSLLSGATGVLVFQDQGTATTEDDLHARYTAFAEPSGKPISFSRVTALCVDRASRLWVGMDIGYGRVLSPENPPRAGALPIVERPVGGKEPPYYYLLAGLTVTAITTDALDRKWMGTASDGLYLLSEDGREVLAHYTMANSPLVSDAITALAFDDASGTLYIGTTAGLSALETEAGDSGLEASPSAYAFPNPLRPEDPIGITFRDLPAGATLRIANASGILCARLESPTTELYWDTLSADGKLLPAGIYLVTIYPPSGGKPQLLKLAILRP